MCIFKFDYEVLKNANKTTKIPDLINWFVTEKACTPFIS